MWLYRRITYQLQFILPGLYKERYFKNLKSLSEENFSERNVEPELVWIKNYLNKKSVILDIGANAGSFLYQLEKKLDNDNIFAFEPNQKLYRRLRRIFPKMNILPFAISDENKTAEFKIPVINGKALNTRGTLKTSFKETGEHTNVTHQVKVIKLDDWAGIDNLTRLDFIKIDVEGNEMHTLKGAVNTIIKFRPTLMVEMEQRHHEEKILNFILQVEKWGYDAQFLNRETFQLEKLTETIIEQQANNEFKNRQQYINNIIFTPQKSRK
ncbi:FkbM family methyltransferase [Chryseobacterium sp.]|uniref:FkbM family methyltransferase n=1 Tax=Chryseobacterium sp. TaxID=1871047 RepID=UPI0011C98F74|nr:FkbM family methyltransferase [Chryseobacterium sp.]TXF75018.1 FkbM family methyltransferase [Chryseobacterium sp.]